MGIYGDALKRGLDSEGQVNMLIGAIKQTLHDASDEISKVLGYSCRMRLERSNYQRNYVIKAYRPGFADESEFPGPSAYVGAISIDECGSYFLDVADKTKLRPSVFGDWLSSKLSYPHIATELVRLGKGKI